MNSLLSTAEDIQSPPSPPRGIDTPKTSSRSISDPSYLQSPATPLYSEKQQEQFTKRKQELELEVNVLIQKRTSLENQLKELKINRVSFSELTLLKASVAQRTNEDNSSKIEELMNSYAEIIKEVRSNQSQVDILETKIREEQERRNLIFGEISTMEQALDLSDLSYKIPEFKGVTMNFDHSQYTSDIERLSMTSNTSKQICNELLCAKPPLNVLTEAASEYSKCTESKWKVRAIGTSIFRGEISALQKQLSETDNYIHKLENEIKNDKSKSESYQNQMRKEEIDLTNNNLTLVQNYKSQITQLESKISNLKTEVTNSANIFESIQQEMEQIDHNRVEMSLKMANYSESEDEPESVTDTEGYSEDLSDNQRNELLDRKLVLQKEVSKLREDYQKLQAQSSAKKEKKIQELSKIYAKYKSAKHRLNKNGLSGVLQLDDSPFRKKIGHLIHKIDSNILEISQNFESGILSA
ncbi:hypothetical protein TVAG_402450 [Trichomonas vaginalis G3]|uniref:Uncharacterized protein n=1 Tax=Trichomonas vaginalis (strain ATCC PRA-98 / G3) TaxID=412133 RepID=A2DI01_TRIV3|nr:hypothetical protein TVAGG3_0272040 [Trichomonas vaginalis G3]EAY19990.1 hypothetical protein TVAG_402450 [Trichomonas vaginalis G3]KAI5525941.1 hypothetical protein TVAGG3_0272040 [Trichomonas vaginalis G3]|eukprot:XP_001580976.1 hypothetical protein [Trichomonas vaginalis G3]